MTGVETSYLAETSSEHNPLSKVDNVQPASIAINLLSREFGTWLCSTEKLQSGCVHCTSDRATNQDVTVFNRNFWKMGGQEH